MNSKTAKLLRKAATIMAFFKMQNTGQQVDPDSVYNSLKAQWRGTPVKNRNKTRKALKRMVVAARTKAPEPEIELDESPAEV